MIIIVESGSTKSDWVVLEGGSEKRFETIGLNPYFHTEQEIEAAIKANVGLFALSGQIDRIYFYGAGCSAAHLNEIIEKGIKRIFKNAIVHVDHDLTACAYATYNGSPAISCILGTGSNSCFYDGFNVYEEVPALGYILGDEGSGSYFGKHVLSDYLYNKLPMAMAEKLAEENWSKDAIIDRVYRQPHANVFLASFMPFIVGFKNEPYVIEMVKHGFRHFVQNHVLCFENAKSVQVHFVGSVAHFFASELRTVCSELGVNVGNIIRRPVDGLIKFHTEHIINA